MVSRSREDCRRPRPMHRSFRWGARIHIRNLHPAITFLAPSVKCDTALMLAAYLLGVIMKFSFVDSVLKARYGSWDTKR